VVQQPEPEEFDGEIIRPGQARITSASYTNRTPSEKWSQAETDVFYTPLSQCGTDFSLIERLFPNRTRRQIRNKFKKEERDWPHKVDEALRSRIPLDIAWFRKMSGLKAKEEKAAKGNNEDESEKTLKEEDKEEDILSYPLKSEISNTTNTSGEKQMKGPITKTGPITNISLKGKNDIGKGEGTNNKEVKDFNEKEVEDEEKDAVEGEDDIDGEEDIDGDDDTHE